MRGAETGSVQYDARGMPARNVVRIEQHIARLPESGQESEQPAQQQRA